MASSCEHPPAAASNVNSDKPSRSADFVRAAQEAGKPPRLRRRHPSTVSVPSKSDESNKSSGSRHRGAVRRPPRTSEVVPPHSPGELEPVRASPASVTANR
ncbi:hypothetical protein MRX96_023271 [Rhipicephalus microplus]